MKISEVLKVVSKIQSVDKSGKLTVDKVMRIVEKIIEIYEILQED